MAYGRRGTYKCKLWTRNYPMQGKKLMEAMQNCGGKEILQRIMQAYGFNMQKELGDHLDIPSGTMSAWIRREHFPEML